MRFDNFSKVVKSVSFLENGLSVVSEPLKVRRRMSYKWGDKLESNRLW